MMHKNKFKKEAEELIEYCKKNKLIITYYDLSKKWKYNKGWLNKIFKRGSSLMTIKKFNKIKKKNPDLKRLTFKELRRNYEPKSNCTKRWIVLKELRRIKEKWYINEE